MNPAKLIAMMGGLGFVGYGITANPGGGAPGTYAIPFPSGAKSGDLAFVYARDTTGPGTFSTSGWTEYATPVMSGAIRTKVLAAADLVATVTTVAGTGPILVLVFRGYTGVNLLSQQGETDSGGAPDDKTWTGFTKGASCRGLVFFTFAGSAAGAAMVFDAPVLAGAQDVPPTGAAGNSLAVALARYDLLASEYVNGTNIEISGYTTGWDGRAFVAFELL